MRTMATIAGDPLDVILRDGTTLRLRAPGPDDADVLLEFFRGRHAGLLTEIRDTGAMPEGGALENASAEFKRHFLEQHGGGADDPGAEHVSADAEAPGKATTPGTLETE